MLQDFMAHFSHDLGARVKGLVHAMAKAHQPEGVLLALGPLQGFWNSLLAADLFQHAQHRLQPTSSELRLR